MFTGFHLLTHNHNDVIQPQEISYMKRTPLIATFILLFSLLTGMAHADQAAININTADVATLSELNGIGQSKAEAIVAYREAHGPFQAPQELANVKGIGERTVEKNATRLTIK
jgi:competence protein ComEA